MATPLVFAAVPLTAQAATLAVCRQMDSASPSTTALFIPAGSLFRDTGRIDDPLAAFTGDRWQLRLETIVDATIPPLRECVLVWVRITSDSSVKSVSLADNRNLVYAGNSNLLDATPPSEELLTLVGRVLDQVP
ncbi:hypothetical protein [Caulobacter sp.]|uniref:hypothetical protein n=1 Tax=Caulobacter sp. TaxID=78 RepID=UPI002B4A8C0F|nr:hypothetical protein [Caulobacter sp.]HJV40526.1 hypothetical protein [Caulobacter sp.]